MYRSKFDRYVDLCSLSVKMRHACYLKRYVSQNNYRNEILSIFQSHLTRCKIPGIIAARRMLFRGRLPFRLR